MELDKLMISLWNKHRFLTCLIGGGLFIAWLVWGFFIFQERKQIKARIQARQEAQLRQEERLRLQAAYEQRRLQEQFNRGTSRNVVDDFKR